MIENININPIKDYRADKIIVTTVVEGIEREKAVSDVGKDTYLKLKVDRKCAVLDMYASFYTDKGYVTTFCASFLEIENGMDVYTVYPLQILNKSDVYFVKIDCNTPYGKKYFSFSGNHGFSSDAEGTPFQLLITDEKYEEPSWFSNGIIYHIFVDRFFKGNENKKREDAVYFDDWYNDIPEYPEKTGDFLKNNTFFGGDIWGIIKKLDYIKSLGTNTIYLSPIFEAYSNHKYDTGNYLKVDDGFGGDEALKALISACKEKGINVILDGVFNHVGDDSVYFNRYGKYDSVGACQSKDSPYYKWFDFYDYPSEYDSWWGIKNLPKVRKVPEFRKFICEEVIPKYIKMGISGWRLDVADELEKDFLKEIVSAANKYKNDVVVIGEVWEDASCKSAYGELKHYFDGERLDSVTNYPLRKGLISFLKSKNSSELKRILRVLNSHYPLREQNLLMNILGTHDTDRILTVLGDENVEGLSNRELSTKRLSSEKRKAALKLLMDGYTILIAMPGVPCLYYGDEAGMEGYHDPFNRCPFPWGKEEEKLVSFFSFLGKLRNKSEVLKHGEFRLLDSQDSILAFERYIGKESIITIANYSDYDISIKVNGSYICLLNQLEFNEMICVKANSVVLAEKIQPYK